MEFVMRVLSYVFVFLLSFNLLAQTRDETLKQFMQERKIMMQQMMQLLQDDFDNDFFSDEADPFFGGSSFKGKGKSIELEEKYEDDGSISIIITPKKENMNLDITTDNNMIVIKSEVTKGNKGSQFSSSKFSQSISTPNGYTAHSPVAHGKGVKISLVPSGKVKKMMKKKMKKQSSAADKVPVGKQPGEETI
jgi:hypothetical protein